MPDEKNIPINFVNLLPVLDAHLLQLLKSLQPADWERQTVARRWKVKDVAAHLLDGNIRILSMLRDGYFGEQPVINKPQDLLDYLNGLNADWVKAMRRVSPPMLILLHEATGILFNEYYASVDPFGIAPFAVNWAGETESYNWMHIAREYTEKWLHQQQIRHAIGDESLMIKGLFYPFMDIFMYALPFTYRNVDAAAGTVIRITIPGEHGGSWHIERSNDSWVRIHSTTDAPTSELIIDAQTSWQLFSKSIRPDDVRANIIIRGDQQLGEVALNMVSVMA